MSNYVELKSKALDVFGYWDVDISRFLVNFEPDLEEVEKELMLLRKKHSEIIEAEEVLVDDVVTLSCKSENKRFNKASISIRIGKGLFHKELEQKLVGMKKQEERKIVMNEDLVCIYIEKISRNNIPELTDEVVTKWNFEKLKSVKELREWIIEKQNEKFLDEDEYVDTVVSYISMQAVEKSSFALDESECKNVEAEVMKRVLTLLQEHNLSLETMTIEQSQEILGSSVEEYIAFVKGIFLNSLKIAAIGNKLMKEELQPLTIEDYEMEVKGFADFLGHNVEVEKQSYTIEDYMKNGYSDYYLKKILIYAYKNLIKKEK